MTNSMFLELIPVAIFMFGSVALGYIVEVISRAIKLYKKPKRKPTKQHKQVVQYIEYRKAM